MTIALSSSLQRIRARVSSSAWLAIVMRIAFFAGGLIVLAWIGRAATAATPPGLATTNDGGAMLPVLPAPAPATATATAAAAATAPASSAPPPAPPSQARPPPPGSHPRATADDPVYVNVAPIEELRRLPGVGPKRAEAIVALRQRVGRFQRIEDLLRVKGVGRTTLRKWRPLLRLDSPPATTADAGPA